MILIVAFARDRSVNTFDSNCCFDKVSCYAIKRQSKSYSDILHKDTSLIRATRLYFEQLSMLFLMF